MSPTSSKGPRVSLRPSPCHQLVTQVKPRTSDPVTALGCLWEKVWEWQLGRPFAGWGSRRSCGGWQSAPSPPLPGAALSPALRTPKPEPARVLSVSQRHSASQGLSEFSTAKNTNSSNQAKARNLESEVNLRRMYYPH